ncbi:MAG: diacylglycerol kinase family lipid kinase [Ardenticatenaceae bacterium]|nr:diacylglycerol kinase family lipid kinase [Anaerolineales bacterium]MCB8979394.1 diacylglycerol kinase family lipid kinase [Ardenticatenaceae bacterium]
MKIKVILNPYANRWRAGSRVDEVRAAFAAVGLSPDIAQTSKPQEGITLAETAVAEGYDVVVGAGGDGTLSEVANGLLRAAGAGPTVPFGILPIGTANDFSDMVGLPRDLAQAVKIIAAGKTRQIDAGRINDHFFINNCAVAMEPMITLENIHMKRLSGEIRYVVALLKGLIKLKAWHMQVQWDGGGYDGPTYLLSVCNGPRTGGFYMAPDAAVDDGLFDFVFAPKVPKRTVLIILAKLFRKTHIYHPQVVYGRTTRISIISQPGTPIHADGEIITEAATHVEYEILPGKLTLLQS